MSLDLAKMAKARISEFARRTQAAMNRWGDLIKVSESLHAKEGRNLTEMQKANMAQVLDNFLDMTLSGVDGHGAINETTFSDAISFARQMLPVIPALLPALTAEHVAVVQAIDRPLAFA